MKHESTTQVNDLVADIIGGAALQVARTVSALEAPTKADMDLTEWLNVQQAVAYLKKAEDLLAETTVSLRINDAL